MEKTLSHFSPNIVTDLRRFAVTELRDNHFVFEQMAASCK